MPNFEQSPAQEVPENEAKSDENISDLIDSEIKRLDADDAQNKVIADDIEVSIDEEINGMKVEGANPIKIGSAADHAAKQEIGRMIKEEISDAEKLGEESVEVSSQEEYEEKLKKMRTEGSATIQNAASEIVKSTMESQIDNALLMADAPEAARSILMDETIESIRKTLMTSEDIAKAGTNERVGQLLSFIDSSVIKEAKSAMLTALSDKMESITDPAEISKYNKLIEAIESEN